MERVDQHRELETRGGAVQRDARQPRAARLANLGGRAILLRARRRHRRVARERPLNGGGQRGAGRVLETGQGGQENERDHRFSMARRTVVTTCSAIAAASAGSRGSMPAIFAMTGRAMLRWTGWATVEKASSLGSPDRIVPSA